MTPTILEPGIDCAIFRRGSKLLRFDSGSDDPLVRAEAVRAAYADCIAHADPYETVITGAGVFDFGKDAPLVFPSCNVAGLGRYSTRYLGSVLSDDLGTNFQLQDTNLSGMVLIQKCWNPNEDGRCVGFDADNHAATIRDCDLWCTDWTVWNWGAKGSSLLLAHSRVTTGRVGIAAENSGDGQRFHVNHCLVIGDASLSQSIGATSDKDTGGVFGIVHRGGDLYVSDTEFQIKGKESVYPSFTPRACAITDRGGAGSGSAGNTRVDLWQNRFRVAPNGADPKRCFDLDFSDQWIIDSLEEHGCCGTGWRGELSRSF